MATTATPHPRPRHLLLIPGGGPAMDDHAEAARQSGMHPAVRAARHRADSAMIRVLEAPDEVPDPDLTAVAEAIGLRGGAHRDRARASNLAVFLRSNLAVFLRAGTR